jgi:beta-aspartyl-peptidase (threonine type)
MALRAATARSIVLYLKMGLPLWDAAREAVLDLHALDDPFASTLNIVAIDTQGNHVGFSNRPKQRYIFQTAEMDAPAERPRVYVGPDGASSA